MHKLLPVRIPQWDEEKLSLPLKGIFSVKHETRMKSYTANINCCVGDENHTLCDELLLLLLQVSIIKKYINLVIDIYSSERERERLSSSTNNHDTLAVDCKWDIGLRQEWKIHSRALTLSMMDLNWTRPPTQWRRREEGKHFPSAFSVGFLLWLALSLSRRRRGKSFFPYGNLKYSKPAYLHCKYISCGPLEKAFLTWRIVLTERVRLS